MSRHFSSTGFRPVEGARGAQGYDNVARINLEECWWSDPRRDLLARHIGNQDLTETVVIRAWRLAQEFWTKGKLIPWPTFSALLGADALVKSGLAQIRDSDQADSKPIQAESKQCLDDCYVYVRGSSEYLNWVREQRIKGASGGKKSAKRPRDAHGRLLKTSKQSPSSHQANSKGVQASYSYSYSSSDSNSEKELSAKNENLETGGNVVAIAPTPPEVPAPKGSKFSEHTRAKMRTFLGAYANAYRTKYGGAPEGIRQKALIGKVGHWIEHVSEARALSLIQVYLQVDHRPINESYHDLWNFFRHLNRIGVALDTGKDANQIDWGKVFGRAQ